ncbi:hypothetical protein T281_08385 [Rhodomicrobium udaipurense JA643]|uniref:DUF2130 domain-containing protein n=1 Tax=Rhodomicrobium udaipurense TaxID=1202716 RepID=A0A8I1GFA9_9HYPH|nr:DUF2130 domain-containing protein [Rhodomicrobium udaipurense]KAI94929.1 hypothetical protein T281_08385 [Rhodomicrobium udaipurense JA643]MBJ7543949.1 DUF2130 domain-containing protein [Rhodomicrobium udaipurense]
MEPSIVCPNCRSEIKLTETLAAPLLQKIRAESEELVQRKEVDFLKREAAIRAQQHQIREAKDALEAEVVERLKTERKKLIEEEARKARAAVLIDLQEKARELDEANLRNREQEAKLAEAQKAQADAVRKERELEDARRELDLTIERRVAAQQSEIQARAKKEAEEQLLLKVQEREQTIHAMQKQIEELKRKAEQGSQQLQGEVQELQLEALLRSSFPHDIVTPVPKGEFGGDAIQQVTTPLGQDCGKILWESKRTRNWSDGWLVKLRDDQRVAKADAAIIVSHALPKSVEAFGQIDGIWVVSPKCAVAMAIAVRHLLIEVAAARKSAEGQQSKMEAMYQYLTGPRFRHRVEAIVEKFAEMQADLERERKAMQKAWAKREAQIRGVIDATAGMYGDMQGIAGRSLQEIDGLDFATDKAIELSQADQGRIRLLNSDGVS